MGMHGHGERPRGWGLLRVWIETLAIKVCPEEETEGKFYQNWD